MQQQMQMQQQLKTATMSAMTRGRSASQPCSVNVAHDAPECVAAHVQVPLPSSHTPWPLHVFTQRVFSHARPPKPYAQVHTVASPPH
jgi:hypothetical protein